MICTQRAAIPNKSSTPPPTLSINTSTRGTPAAVPNKHIPLCSPGPQPASRQQQQQLETPPESPPSPTQVIETTSLLYPPEGYVKLTSDPPIYAISAEQLASSLNHLSTQPLPSPKQVFPWLHGLHADNQLQLAFFTARRKSLRRTPRCIRGITIVKAGGDLTHSKLKGAVAPEEILKCPSSKGSPSSSVKAGEDGAGEFLQIDPRDGFSVRNFQIQACKMATVSDIVVYGDGRTSRKEVERTAQRMARAQLAWQKRVEGHAVGEEPLFNTFVVTGKLPIY